VYPAKSEGKSSSEFLDLMKPRVTRSGYGDMGSNPYGLGT